MYMYVSMYILQCMYVYMYLCSIFCLSIFCLNIFFSGHILSEYILSKYILSDIFFPIYFVSIYFALPPFNLLTRGPSTARLLNAEQAKFGQPGICKREGLLDDFMEMIKL